MKINFSKLIFVVFLLLSCFSKSVIILNEHIEKSSKNQNSLEKKITGILTNETKPNIYAKKKPYSEVLDSVSHKNKIIYLVKYVEEKNWSESLYLIVVLKKKNFWSKKVKEKILWKTQLNGYGRIVEKAKLKKDDKNLKIYTVTATHKGAPSLELYQLSLKKDLQKKSKLNVLKNMKPHSIEKIKKIKKEMKKLDEKFGIPIFKKIGEK